MASVIFMTWAPGRSYHQNMVFVSTCEAMFSGSGAQVERDRGHPAGEIGAVADPKRPHEVDRPLVECVGLLIELLRGQFERSREGLPERRIRDYRTDRVEIEGRGALGVQRRELRGIVLFDVLPEVHREILE